MKIRAKVAFMHGRQRFEAGTQYEVPDGPGYYFCASGWAEDIAGQAPSADPATEPVTLKIDDVMLGHNAPTVGG